VDVKVFGRDVTLNGRAMLFVVPVLWASFNPIVRFLYTLDYPMESSVFNSIRLTLSSLCFLPVYIAEFSGKSGEARRESLVDGKGLPLWAVGGLELGLWVFLANFAQFFALEFNSATRATFLIQLQTVMVPTLAAIFGIEKISLKTAGASAVCVLGVLILSLDKPTGGAVTSSLQGDLLCLLSALFHALYVLRLGSKYAGRTSSGLLVGGKVFVQCAFSWLWAISTVATKDITIADSLGAFAVGDTRETLIILGVAAWMGLVASALSGWLQTNGQKVVPASETAVLFSMQPLWATAMAVTLLGETIGTKSIVGGGLIVGATVIASLKTKKS